MREQNWRQQRSPSPKSTPPMLPPLSKFYYGPEQGWSSNESSPIHNGSIGSLIPNLDMNPALPPRQSAGPVTHRSAHQSQGWNSPAPSASSASQHTYIPYMSNSWALKPDANDAPIDPTWNSGPSATSTGTVCYRHKHPRVPDSTSKPLLPPKPRQHSNQPGLYESRLPSSRFSATTIDVPLFLHPVAYDPVSAPPLPGSSPSTSSNDRSRPDSLPEPQRVPPPPPQEKLLDNNNEADATTMKLRRPQYNPQHNSGEGKLQDEQRSQRPRFAPSRGDLKSPSQRQHQHQEQQPLIPVPQFTNFDVETALPLVRDNEESQLCPAQQKSRTFHPQPKIDIGGNHVGQHLQKSSTLAGMPSDKNQWLQSAKSCDRPAASTPSPERQYAVLIHQDGHSISTTDLSSTTAGKSTPDSQQTSLTSYPESETLMAQNMHEQKGDDSFYWHSGRSSSDAEEERSQSSSPAATPGQASVDRRSSTTNSTVVPHGHPELPVRLTSLSPSHATSYSASALGFGGPSDWEYFGDYKTEEIDDEELYSRPRPRDYVSATEGSTELPADSAFTDLMQSTGRSELLASRSTIIETPLTPKKSPTRQYNVIPSQGHTSQSTNPFVGNENAARMNSALKQCATAESAQYSDVTVSQNMPSEQRPDLDELIRAWSEAPLVGKILEDGSHFDETEGLYEEPADVAEASLASTPRERMFGVDIILKDAPSLPKMPASIDRANRAKIRTQSDGSSARVPSEEPSGTPESKNKILSGSLSEQPTPVLGTERKSVEDASFDDERMSSGVVTETPSAQDAEPSSSYLPVASDLRDVVLIEFMTASDLSFRNLAGNELLGASTEDAILALQEVSPVQMTQTVQSEPPKLSPQEANHDMLGKSSEQITLDRPRTTSQPIIQYSVEELSSCCSDHDTSIGYQLASSARTSTSCRQWSTRIVRSDSLQEMTSGLAENSGKSAHGDDLEGPEVLDYAERSRDRSPQDSKAAQYEIAADHLPVTTEANKATATSKHTLVEVGEMKERQQLDTPTAPVINSPGSIETLKETHQNHNPFADLDPWAQASLNRFAAMLREEARADSNEDKLKIFNVFTNRESRLRVILYGTEDELIIPQKEVEESQELHNKQGASKKPVVEEEPEARGSPATSGSVKQVLQTANTMNLQRSLKALPALPSNRDSVIGLSGNALAPLIIRDSSKSAVDAESPTVGSPLDEASYSMDGKTLAYLSSVRERGGELDISQRIVASAESTAGANANKLSGSDAPFLPESQDSATERPAYTALKSKEPRSEVKNYLANRKSIIRPYATLTQEPSENESSFGQELDSNTTPTNNPSITALMSQYNRNLPSRFDDAPDVVIKAQGLIADSQHDLRRFMKADFDPLLTVLPQSESLVFESTRLNDLGHIMEAVPDDFSFIHQSVVAWDAKAKKQREENDRQRHARQMESEQRIDSLFNDHEIGYGDISELEAEFKRSEAARKADEDRSEYHSFVSDVFNSVWTRLHYELDQLIPHYEKYSELMNDTLAGKDMFNGSADSLALAPTMSAFLGLHQKIEIRHQKAFEAVLERDRRLKKTEISPWYSLSNISKVKQLEKQFEDAEKTAIIEYCQQRDTRVNRLMDVLDQNTLRGVGANQDYMEAIMKAVRRIASGRAFASIAGANEPAAGMEEVEKAKAITTLLATSSEQIVQTFHVADMLLNSADYEVSVAKAKVARADPATLTNLKEERTKEDQKLMRDLEHRLALIREDSRRTNDEIVKLMLFLGVQNGSAPAPAAAVHADSKSGAAHTGSENA